jgi:hypothetical protein
MGGFPTPNLRSMPDLEKGSWFRPRVAPKRIQTTTTNVHAWQLDAIRNNSSSTKRRLEAAAVHFHAPENGLQ